ncbi:MAG: TIR domain-containing protein [Clostridium sp.]|nr:TIR domain-containing protein [Clostridium sp.]
MQTASQPAQRQYKAFISYRHKPLDMETAKKLHRRIEQYIIPRDLRKNGEKKLGLVFRDQDELPISNNLSRNIREALDHSEYLIVVCTPDTPESIWVHREITYFKEHHGEDRVLAILADGTPETSFPAPLREVRDQNGNVTDVAEPLAANIVADSAARRNRLFRTESLRILASLIGCPYDVLYKREQRHKIRELAAGSAAAILVLSAFIGVLLNRNAKIHEQFMQTKISESRTLAALSKNALRDGDYRSAIEHALSALPGRDPDRPYVPAAEYALSNALYLYSGGDDMRYVQSIDQDTEISKIALSGQRKYLCCADAYGKLSMYDAVSGAFLWEKQFAKGRVSSLEYVGEDLVIATDQQSIAYRVKDGEIAWEKDGKISAYAQAGAYGLMLDSMNGVRIRQIDLKTGEVLRETEDPEHSWYNAEEQAVSPDGRYAAVLYEVYDKNTGDIVVYDLGKGGNGKKVSAFFYKTLFTDCVLCFGPENELVVGCCGNEDKLADKEGWEGAFVELLDPEADWAVRFHVTLDFGEAVRSTNGVVDSSDYMDYMHCGTAGIAAASKNRLIMVEKDSGKIRWTKDLPGYVCGAEMYTTDSLGLVLSNGLVTLCSGEYGTLGYEYMIGAYDCGYEICKGAVSGSSYRTSRFAVIPQGDRTRASILAVCQGENLEKVPETDRLDGSVRLYSSASGNVLAGIARTSDFSGYMICLIDPSGEKTPVEYELKDTPQILEQEQIYVADDGRVILGEKAVDPKAGTVSVMSVDGQSESRWSAPGIRSCREGGNVLSARVQRDGDGSFTMNMWRNGEPAAACPLSAAGGENDTASHSEGECMAVGGCGYAVAWLRDGSYAPKEYRTVSLKEGMAQECTLLDPDAEEVIGLADTHPWMAVQRADGSVCLADLSNGKVMREFKNPLPASGVVKILFAQNDQWLLAFTNGGDLAVFRTADGTVLYRAAFTDNNVSFRSGVRYDVFHVPGQNRLLIIDDDSSYTEAFCISIDTDSFSTNGFYHGFSNWLPETGRAVIFHRNDQVCCAPLLSLGEIQAMGEELLEKGIEME